MKRLLLLACAFTLLFPVLAAARPIDSTVVVYKGKLKLVGHEFEAGGNQGVPFKDQDNIWLVVRFDAETWDVYEAYEVYYWATATGYQGNLTTASNLALVVDTVSSRMVATLYSMDLNNDSLAPSVNPSDMDLLVAQGPMSMVFTGVKDGLVPKTLKGYAMGLWSWTDGVTYNNVGAGTLTLALDKSYTLLANGQGMLAGDVALSIQQDLATGKGVVFLGAP